MQNKVLINEIFESMQGEGLYAGVNQLFIRFAACNLNCAYCDTDYKTGSREYTVSELELIINSCKNIHSISLTGGEPLTEADFLSEFLPRINPKRKIYLETNGTLHENLKKVINDIDIISMDLKLPSCTKGRNCFNEHEEFIKAAAGKELFLKAVFDENITGDEILQCCRLAAQYKLPLVIQPAMKGNAPACNTKYIKKIYRVFVMLYPQTRMIPQIHKYLDMR